MGPFNILYAWVDANPDRLTSVLKLQPTRDDEFGEPDLRLYESGGEAILLVVNNLSESGGFDVRATTTKTGAKLLGELMEQLEISESRVSLYTTEPRRAFNLNLDVDSRKVGSFAFATTLVVSISMVLLNLLDPDFSETSLRFVLPLLVVLIVGVQYSMQRRFEAQIRRLSSHRSLLEREFRIIEGKDSDKPNMRT